ncbi:S8 family serine peptidase [Streptomyces sulphureus]|uniref:S8 family serine peptidase n=1 Tax=Streptomyces sulphureus TaxID=47758 RepID=UPI00316AD46D
MWETSKGKGIKVAVVDSGVNSGTTSLRGRVLPGKDVSGAPGGATDDQIGHGTTMAEMIAGSGRGGGLRGLAPESRVIPIRTEGKGMRGGKGEDTLPEALRAAADSEAKIINMSIGGEYSDPDLEAAVNYAAHKGKLMFASSGNDGAGKNKNNYPAGYSQVIGVGSVDKNGTVGDTSGNGQHVSLAAPGVDLPIWCDGKFEGYCSSSGTSIASALASASAALIWSKHPDWTANQVARVLVSTTGRMMEGKKPSKYFGYGTVRPRENILAGKGDPGQPAQPAFAENGDFIRNPGTSSPSAAAEPSEGSSSSGDNKAGNGAGQADEAAAETDSGSSNSALWWGVGAVAAVVVIGGAVALVLRKRRAG